MTRAAFGLGLVLLAAACTTPPPAAGALRDDGSLPAKQRGGSWVYEMAAYSPDRSTVAVVGMSPDDRAALGIARHAKVRVVTKPDIAVADFAWLDAGHLVVAFTDFDEDRIGEDRPQRFAVLDTDGRIVREVPFTEPLVHDEPVGMTVSADGTRLLTAMRPFGERGGTADVVEIDLVTGRTRVVARTPDSGEWSPVYLADGRIVVVTYVVAPVEEAPTLTLLDPHTSKGSPLDSGDGAVEHVTVVGSRVVYSAGPGGSGAGEVGVFAYDVASRARSRIASQLCRNPTAVPGGGAVLCIAAPHGGDPAPVVTVNVPPAVAGRP